MKVGLSRAFVSSFLVEFNKKQAEQWRESSSQLSGAFFIVDFTAKQEETCQEADPELSEATSLFI